MLYMYIWSSEQERRLSSLKRIVVFGLMTESSRFITSLCNN